MFTRLKKLAHEAERAAEAAESSVAESEALSRPLIDDLKAIKRRNHIYASTLAAIQAAASR